MKSDHYCKTGTAAFSSVIITIQGSSNKTKCHLQCN